MQKSSEGIWDTILDLDSFRIISHRAFLLKMRKLKSIVVKQLCTRSPSPVAELESDLQKTITYNQAAITKTVHNMQSFF